jgi:hypothetical protein
MKGAVPILLLAMPFTLNAAAQERPVLNSFSWSCGMGPPATVAEWWQRADLIVRVRIDSQFAYADQQTLDPVVTAHEATVSEVIKAHPRAVGVGASQTILQFGGTLDNGREIIVHSANGFQILPVGSEWLLFLRWDQYVEGFTPVTFAHGAFQIIDGKLVTPNATVFEKTWHARSANALIRALERERR